MPAYLIYLWVLVLFVAALFWGVRVYLRRYGDVANTAVSTTTDVKATDTNQPEEVVFWSQAQVRWLVAVLFTFGVLLVWMGQALYREVPLPQRWAVFGFMGLGVFCFMIATKTAVAQNPPRWLIRATEKVTTYFRINLGQLALILFAPCFSLIALMAAGEMLKARDGFVSIAAFGVSIGTVLVGFYSLRSDGDETEKVDIKRFDLIFSILLFVTALMLRGLATAQFPDTFSGDEGSSGLHAALYLNGEASNILTVGWFSFPGLFFAVQAATIALFGQTIEALRLFSAFGGALAVVALYFMGLIFFDRITAVLAAIYLAASHYHVHMSRVGLNNIWDSFFGVVAFAGLWHGWKTGRRSSFLLCGLALGMGQYFYVSMRVLPILFAIWAAAAFIWKRPLFMRRLPGLISTAVISFVTVLPLGIFFWGHPNEFAAPLNRVTIWGPWLNQMMETTQQSALSVLGQQMVKATLGFTHEPLQLLYNPGAPLLLTGAAALFLLGILWGLLHFDLRYLLLFLPVLSTIVSSGISQHPPASQRFILVVPIVALFVALPLGQVVRILRPMWPRFGHVVVAGTLVVMLIVAWRDIDYYFTEVYDDGEQGEGYVLGGLNTYAATEIAHYLQEKEPTQQKVLFFGFPRMGYFSLSTIPYLVPEMMGEDITEPLTAPPDWQLIMPTIFIFLPERVNELQYVQQRFPVGDYREFVDKNGSPLFTVYEVRP